MSREQEDNRRFVQALQDTGVKRLREIVTGHVQNVSQYEEAHSVGLSKVLENLNQVLDAIEALNQTLSSVRRSLNVRNERVTRGNHGEPARSNQAVARSEDEELLSLLRNLLSRQSRDE